MMRRPLTSVELTEEDIKDMNNILVERMLILAKKEAEKGDKPTVGILKLAEPSNKTDTHPRVSSGLSSPLARVQETPPS